MKNCPRCGHENTDEVRFCIQCQHRFGAPVAPRPPDPGSEKRPDTAPKPPRPPTVIQHPESFRPNPPGGDLPRGKTPAEPAPASKNPRSSTPRRGTTFKPASSLEDAGTETGD